MRPLDLTATYTPPTVAEGSTPTDYEYNLDRQLARILRPDGDTVAFAYDTAGRPSGVTHADGALAYGYSATTGNLTSVTAGSEALGFAYDGSLLTDVTWTGPVAGQVTAGYDTDFRVTSLSVNGTQLAAFAIGVKLIGAATRFLRPRRINDVVRGNARLSAELRNTERAVEAIVHDMAAEAALNASRAEAAQIVPMILVEGSIKADQLNNANWQTIRGLEAASAFELSKLLPVWGSGIRLGELFNCLGFAT